MSGEGAGEAVREGGGVGWGQGAGGGRGCTNTSRLPGDAACALRGKNAPENFGPIIGGSGGGGGGSGGLFPMTSTSPAVDKSALMDVMSHNHRLYKY